jgi:hypothetical protein
MKKMEEFTHPIELTDETSQPLAGASLSVRCECQRQQHRCVVAKFRAILVREVCS